MDAQTVRSLVDVGDTVHIKVFYAKDQEPKRKPARVLGIVRAALRVQEEGCARPRLVPFREILLDDGKTLDEAAAVPVTKACRVINPPKTPRQRELEATHAPAPAPAPAPRIGTPVLSPATLSAVKSNPAPAPAPAPKAQPTAHRVDAVETFDSFVAMGAEIEAELNVEIAMTMQEIKALNEERDALEREFVARQKHHESLLARQKALRDLQNFARGTR